MIPNIEAVRTALSPCARCATLQKTCCQRAEILLTEGDVARIIEHTRRFDFHERRVPVSPAYREPDPADPHWLEWTFASDGTRRLLRRLPGGDCTFLGERGCSLPLGVRPLVCRLYPWGYSEHGLDGADEEYCPTATLAPDGRPMADVIDVPRADAERWRVSLYQELRDGHP